MDNHPGTSASGGIQYSIVDAPYWDDAPVAIVGAGPSLAGFDFERLRGPWHVLAIKQKYLDLPWADAVFGLDANWIVHYGEQVVSTGIPTYFAIPDGWTTPQIAGAHYLRRQREGDLFCLHPGMVNHRATSGFGGVNLALLKRAKHLCLFGYDYAYGTHDKPEQYPWSPPGTNAKRLPRWGETYVYVRKQLLELGVDVFNASPISTLTAFTKGTVDAGIQWLHEHTNTANEPHRIASG